MKVVKKIFNAVMTVLLIGLLTVSGAMPTSASNVDAGNQSFNSSYGSVSQNDIQRATTLNKLVCRYINGTKRCWHE